MQKLKVLSSNLEFYLNIYRKNLTSAGKYYAICKRYARRSRQIMLLAYFSYLLVYGTIFVGGICDMCLNNDGSQVVHLYIPGVYDLSPFGNILLMIPNLMIVVMATLCMTPQDMLFYLVFGNVSLVAAIVQSQMEELTVLLRSKQPQYGGDVTFVKHHFLHYIDVHYKYNE